VAMLGAVLALSPLQGASLDRTVTTDGV